MLQKKKSNRTQLSLIVDRALPTVSVIIAFPNGHPKWFLEDLIIISKSFHLQDLHIYDKNNDHYSIKDIDFILELCRKTRIDYKKIDFII